MLPEERDAAHLWDMLSAAREGRTMLQGASLEQFRKALIVMRATERCIEIIGEAARRVSKTTQQLQTEIPWSDLIGQRNIGSRIWPDRSRVALQNGDRRRSAIDCPA